MNWVNLVNISLSLAPQIVQAAQGLFGSKEGSKRGTAALAMAEAGITAALGLKPDAFGPAEKALIQNVHTAVVTYYNAKGWPTS